MASTTRAWKDGQPGLAPLLDHRLLDMTSTADAARPGYDFIVQGMGGMMDLTAGNRTANRRRSASQWATCFTGLYSRRRDPGRAGATRDHWARGARSTWRCSMRRSLCSPTWRTELFLVSGRLAAGWATPTPIIVPYQVFRAADGPLIIATGNNRQYARSLAGLDSEELADDPAHYVRERGSRAQPRKPSSPWSQTAIEGARGAAGRAIAANVPAGPIYTDRRILRGPAGRSHERCGSICQATGARGGTAPRRARLPIMA